MKKYIGAFGGYGENVTVFGESAGAGMYHSVLLGGVTDVRIASVLYQLHSKEPLFNRPISMSGTPVMLKPLAMGVAEMSYTSIIKSFGLEGASAAERIERLKSASSEELVEKTPMSVPLLPFLQDAIIPKLTVPPLPHQDDATVPSRTTFAKLATAAGSTKDSVPGFKWCESLLIGSTKHDGSVFLFMGLSQRKSGIATTLATSLHKHISGDAAMAILDAYDITPTTSDDEALQRIIDFATDIAYVAPALAYARVFPGKSYLYNFDELNPWDGPLKGLSTHMLDAAYLFQNFNEDLSEKAREVTKTFAMDFVRFANGVEPWEKYTKEKGTCRVYGPSEKCVVGVLEGDGWATGRRNTLWRLSEGGKVDLDPISVAWDMFVAGR